jgi:predicted anti-sigma-YlaC factor YlaD
MSVDPFAHDDAAYVLGALSPAQRRAFEEHLEACSACARSVRDLAGLPGLLAGLPADAYAETTDLPPVPDTMLPTLLQRVRRTRQRARWLTWAGAAAAAVVLAVAVTVALLAQRPDAAQTAAPPPAQTMQQVHQDQLTATVSLQQVAWGTKMHLACRYAGTWVQPGASYALRVHTAGGETQQIATWKALADKTTQLDAATSVDPVDIEAVDVVLVGSDRPLLTLDPTVVS